ncbi:cellulose binding domain-containing protein [Goodfellowiella coeruleoviolacea]|uniref:Cellulose binding domain-containing protein n=1 Tax=Goodfellowiella coeruleoviolacea TaxID=334858 RepID=A0AAE3G997_9PSEU|nr:cellulose binding domain-containing protein [Goodfellowiella coeruleoviolacea]MCP2163230.1 Cellulose binding domain-containing protein [Goodfellowiella coeruleoviolacea]
MFPSTLRAERAARPTRAAERHAPGLAAPRGRDGRGEHRRGARRRVTQLWGGSHTQQGAEVTVTNASGNGAIPTGGTVTFGFQAGWTGTNTAPAAFARNGTPCTTA